MPVSRVEAHDPEMPEGLNVEVAHKLSEAEEHDQHGPTHERWHRVIEIVEVVLLSIAAITTAWSGYQAAKWDGRQSLLYGQASRDRFEADAASTLGGQQLSADSAMLNGWLQARSAGDTQLQDNYVRRFTPDYRTAFDAWLTTNPFSDPNAPPGPGYMPEYKNPAMEQAKTLNDQASALFDEGTEARDNADRYVQDTVLLASVLFLVALAQRLKARAARITANVVAFSLLAFAFASVAFLPRL
jgi:hypothetical protein